MITFEGIIPAEGGVCAAKGFTAGGIHAGIKKNPDKKDLAIIHCAKKCNAAAMFTTNKVKAAPILVSAEHVANGTAQTVVVNSGNANACTQNGLQIARRMCELTAEALHISAQEVLVASTGVIGQPLDISPLETGIEILAAEICQVGSDDAVAAIMTTDTFPKQYAVSFKLGEATCHIGGIAKGSGMINPNMATMLAFITTDAAISSQMLEQALREVNEVTFNRVSVDGDTSTNDMVCVLASGLAENHEIIKDGEDCEKFVAALYSIMANLARDMARDGEGATKLVECMVTGAPEEAVAKAVAKSVISSSLVKAALGAADANWGRILCAIGYADGEFDVGKVDVSIESSKGEVVVCKNGSHAEFSEVKAFEILSEDTIQININLNCGEFEAVAWGCDLTEEYVRINADYRS
jgi:glutamate N-acetyltransferase/amino-acid N-acetyltransferase